MRKTIAKLEAQNTDLQKVLEIVRRERDSAQEMLKFYKTHELLTNTGIIALEKITDVVAHVVSEMKSLREGR
jgi:hypothetical protein